MKPLGPSLHCVTRSGVYEAELLGNKAPERWCGLAFGVQVCGDGSH